MHQGGGSGGFFIDTPLKGAFRMQRISKIFVQAEAKPPKRQKVEVDFSERTRERTKYSREAASNFKGSKCVFCEESLENVLKGEDPPVVLTCSHQSHFDCISILMDRFSTDHHVICPVCVETSRCAHEDVEEKLVREVLLSVDADAKTLDFELLTPVDQFAPHQETTPPPILETQVMHSSSSDTVEEFRNTLEDDILHYITSPQVEFGPEVNKLHLSNEITHKESVDINCHLSVQGPVYHVSPTPNKDHCQTLVSEVMHKLNESVEDWNGIHLGELGELICFDILSIGTGSGENELARCFLFEKIILIVNESISQILGTVVREQLISCLETGEGELELNLTSETLPIVYLAHQNNIIIKKWYRLILKMSSLRDCEDVGLFPFDDNQLVQLSTNSWDLIESHIELVPFKKPSLKIYQMSVPRALRLPVSMILAASVVVPPNEEILDYSGSVRALIRTVLDSLQKTDLFGLVLVGVDPLTGMASCNGTFTGMISPKWGEWDDIIEEIHFHEEQVFEDDYSHLLQCFVQSTSLIQQCAELSRCGSNWIKKLMVVSNVGYNCKESAAQGSEALEGELHHCITFMVDNYAIEIESVLVGGAQRGYSDGYLYYLSNSLKTFSLNSAGYIQVNLCSKFQRFENYSVLTKSIAEHISGFDDIVIPVLDIKIVTQDANAVLVKGFENATVGDFVHFDDATRYDEIRLQLVNLKVNDCRNYLVKMSVDTTLLRDNHEKKFIEIGLATTSATWFNTLKSTDETNSSVRIKVPSPGNSFSLVRAANGFQNPSLQHLEIGPEMVFSGDSVSLLTMDNASELVEIPLLPALISSQREIRYVKREVELILLGALMNSIDTGSAAATHEAVSAVYGIAKSCDSQKQVTVRDVWNASGFAGEKLTKMRFYKYVEMICRRAQEAVSDAGSSGFMDVYDFGFQLGLQQ